MTQAQFVGNRLPLDNDRDINELMSDGQMVINLASYLARSLDYDAHWSKKICQTLFTDAYLQNHLWPSETYVLYHSDGIVMES